MTISPLSGSRYFKAAMLRLLAPCAALLCALATAGASESRNPFEGSIPRSPASAMHGYASMAVNPVFADTVSASWLHYRALSYDTTGDANHMLSLGFAGFSLSYQWLDRIYREESEKAEKAAAGLVSVTKGFFFGNSFGFGVGYSFSDSTREPYDGYRSFTGGLLWRPFRYLSLGFVLRDINEPELNGMTMPRREVYSVSVRPLFESITLSFDAERISGERFHRDDLRLSAQARLPRDISLFACSDIRGNASFGVSVPFGFQSSGIQTAVADYYGDYSHKHAARFSSVGVSITREKYESPVIASKAFLKIALSDEIKELEEERVFGGHRRSFYEIVSAVRAAASDEHIAGIVLQVDGAGLGFAQVQELREELKFVRRSGKKVYALLTEHGNKEYYLAAAADKVCFVPTGTFAITGLSAEVYFIKNIMDRAGVKLESIRRGKYKSFNEPFTRERMSDEYRENLTALLADLNEQFIGDIMADRKIGREAVERMFSRGFMNPEEARAAGFIDVVEYPDVAERELVRSETGVAARVGLDEYLGEAVRIHEWAGIPAVAVVYVPGSIIRGESERRGIFAPEAMGDETYRKALQKAFEDAAVKAVVIRINSGGGSAAASDLMWHYLAALKKKYGKPVVFSFGNVAASGGYYIACTGDKIFLSRGTITGSIGVVSGKLSLKRLYEMLGINKDVIKMSEFADIFTESRDLSEAERQVLQRAVDFTYDVFTGRVQEGRNIPKDKIPSVAEGRVFTGRGAMEHRLADSAGGLLAAIDYAGQRAGISGPYRIEGYPATRAPLMEMLGSVSVDEHAAARLRPLAGSLEWLRFEGETGLYLFPYRVEIK